MSGGKRKTALFVGLPLLMLVCFGGLYLKSRPGEQRIRSDSACPNRIVGEVRSGRAVGIPLISPCSGDSDAYSQPIDSAESSPDRRRLRLTFLFGNYPCGSLSEVRVRRGLVRAVTILLQDADEDSVGRPLQSCSLVGLSGAIEIQLNEPLEQGMIKDGSNGHRIRVKVDPQL